MGPLLLIDETSTESLGSRRDNHTKDSSRPQSFCWNHNNFTIGWQIHKSNGNLVSFARYSCSLSWTNPCSRTFRCCIPGHTLCIIHTTPYQTRTFRCTRATYIPPICQCESENFFPQMLLIPCPNRSHLSSCCSLQLFTSSDSMSTLQLMWQVQWEKIHDSTWQRTGAGELHSVTKQLC